MAKNYSHAIAILASIITIFSATICFARPVPQNLPEFSKTTADIAELVMPSVVTITSEIIENVYVRRNLPFQDEFFNSFFGGRFSPPVERHTFRSQSLGSGVIISDDGLIVTNAHVVDGASEIHIETNGIVLDAHIIGTDKKTDIAILKANTQEKLSPAQIGSSENLRIGEWVLAIGSPFNLEHTVTAGIVSGKSRSQMGITDYEDFIQTDAAINPGNSGGALVDMNGNLVGINTAIFSQTGNNIGIGFAIPIDLVMKVKDEIMKNGEVKRSYLGANFQELNKELAEFFGFPVANGLIVSSLDVNSPAEKAGLLRGDIVIGIDGKKTNSYDKLVREISSALPGTKLTFTVLRGRKQFEIPVTLGNSTDLNNSKVSVANKNEPSILGINVKLLSPDECAQLGFTGQGGVYVDKVEENSIADRANIEVGDILLEINNASIFSLQDLDKMQKEFFRGKVNLFVVWRHGYIIYLTCRT